MTTLDQKVTQLRDLLASFKNVVVCFSGGVDSTYLLSEAVQVLGQHAVALTAISPVSYTHLTLPTIYSV